MSALGEYVHLYWKNYLAHGASKTGKNTITPVGILAKYSAFKDDIRLKVQASGLKAFETKYNQDQTTIFSKLEALNSDIDKENLIRALVKSANYDKVINDSAISLLAKGYSFDKETKNIVFDTKKILSQLKLNNINTDIGGKGDEGKAYLGPLLKKLEDLNAAFEEKDIKKLFPEIGKQFKTFYYNFKSFNTKLSESLNHINGFLGEKEHLTQKNLDTLLKFTDKGGRRALPKEPMKKITKYLRGIQTTISLAKYIVGLRSRFPEVIGEIEYELGYEIAKDVATTEIVNKLKSIGEFGTSGNIQRKGLRENQLASINGIFFFKDGLDNILSSGAVKGKQSLEQLLMKDGDGNVISLKMDYDIKGEQKADFQLLINANESLGVSMKNIDLSSDYYYTKQGHKRANTISLQSETPLIYYLIGMEQYEDKLGTHMLNILSAHNESFDSNGFYPYYREAANKMLFGWILYSAMSGRHQGITGGYADILAIQSTKKINGYPTTIFLDINQLCLDIMNGSERSIALAIPGLMSEIKKINLINNRIALNNEHDHAKGVAIQQRLTLMLLHARTIKLSASISASYIKTYYNGTK